MEETEKKVEELKKKYIKTIKRYLLDFDLEKICSVSLSKLNIYGCLTCGKFYQGRGITTYAYSHSLQEDHHLFINLQTSQIYCLPDGLEINDSSFEDIKNNLKPIYTKDNINDVDKNFNNSYSLEGKKFIPGYIGLNNVKKNDYFNVVIQAFSHLEKIRNFFLMFNNNKHFDEKYYLEVFIKRLSELNKKIWNKNNFKDHVNPIEILQILPKISNQQFTLNKQSDVVPFLSWFINVLNNYFINQKAEIKENLIQKYFTGEIQIETYTLIKDRTQVLKMKKKIVKIDGIEYTYDIKKTKFYYLTLDLPSIPLFKDSNKKINIPQVPIKELLNKFSGDIFIDEPIKEQKKKLKIVSLPKYLILIFKRFHNNMIFLEKNPTIIKFPLENLEILDSTYNILANIIHDGKPEQGTYKIQIKNKIRKEWYQIKDLNVETILPESVLIDESYIQFYEKNSIKKEK